jgi:hypothetical protein
LSWANLLLLLLQLLYVLKTAAAALSHAGAVGTPIWFGFGDIGLGEANLQLTGLKAAIIVGASSFIIAPLAASFLVSAAQGGGVGGRV